MKKIIKKIQLPLFFKTKKFFLLLFLFLLFFFFTPISLHQMRLKIERLINHQAIEGVQKFEEQTGLKIKWGALKFNILTMTVKLKDVKILPLNSLNSQNIPSLKFLDGLQEVDIVSARPSLYTLLFKKQIVLTKVKISGGDIYLKTLKLAYRNTRISAKVIFPIKKIFVEKVNVNLKHNNQNLKLSQSDIKVWQKPGSIFQFNLFLKKIDIDEIQGFKGFSTLNVLKENSEESKNNLEDQTFQLSARGLAKKGQISFKNMIFKNQRFQSSTDRMDVFFDSRGLKAVDVRSSGSIPSILIRKSFGFLGLEPPPFDSLLSYSLNIQYKKRKGYKGVFTFKGESAVFKSYPVKKFFIQGHLMRYLLIVDQGFIQTPSHGNINIKKGEWLLKGEPSHFNFFVETEHLSSEFVSEVILGLNEFPVKGDFTGSIHCLGKDYISYLKCETKGYSERIVLNAEDQGSIASFYGIPFQSDIEWNKENLHFTIFNDKTDSPRLSLKGKYSQPLDSLSSEFSFLGNISRDVKFHAPFPIAGQVNAQNGRLIVERDKVQLNGVLASPALLIQSYKLRNISSLYQYKDDKLRFFRLKGEPGKTNYVAECDINFQKEDIILKLEAPFFDIRDVVNSVGENIFLPFDFKGTGSVSFFMHFPWSSPEYKKFQLKGNLFNVFVNKDFFQQVDFDFGIANKRGIIQSLLFKKGRGFIKGSGFFDQDFFLDIDLVGENLSLERLEWVNAILPFNQSGDVQFKMKLKGNLNQPEFIGDVFVSDMFFYSYPVKDSQLKIKINRKNLSFSGQFMDEIYIERFVYPFSKKANILAIGQFKKLNFIKILLSKNRIEKTHDYLSEVTGSFSLFRVQGVSKAWEGFIKVDQFFLSKFNKWIKNKNAFSVFLNKNKWSLTPVEFFHHNRGYLRLEERGQNKLFVSGESFLGLFSAFFPFLKAFAGHVKGQFLVENNLRQLNPRGNLKIERALFSLDILPEFKNISTDIIFSKNNIFINNFRGRAGGGLLEGKGTVFYDFVKFPHLNLNLNFSDARLDIPEDFRTRGSGQIKIQGSKPPYLISGQYAIQSGNITKDFSENAQRAKYDFSFLKEKIEKQDNLFDLDIDIETKQAVDVSNSLIQSSVEGQAKIYGPLDALLMKGEFRLSKRAEDNIISFRGQEFKILSGFVLFKNSEPENPYINIEANTLFKENIVDPLENNQEVEKIYKIFLSLKGLAKQLRVSLKSAPSLNEQEIISLLTLGVGSRHFDANVKQNVGEASSKLLYSSQLLGSLLLEKPLNREIKHTLGLDFRLTPYINTSNKPVTKITLSKNWFERWKTSFSRTIEEDSQSDVRLKYNINPKMSLTAFWENAENVEELKEEEKDFLGLDLEFNFDF